MLSTIFIILILILTVFLYDYAFSQFALLNYLDEFIVLLFIILFLLKFRGKFFLHDDEKKAFLFLFLTILMGLAGNIYYNYQTISASFKDLVVFAKPFIIYFSVRLIFKNYDILKYKNIYFKFSIISTITIVLFFILQYCIHIFPEGESRFGVITQQLFFSHPSRLAFSIIFCFVLSYPLSLNKKFLLLFILSLGILSTRFKYILFLPFSLLAVYFNKNFRVISTKKIFVFVFSISPILFYLGVDQFLYYFSSNSFYSGFARSILSYYSFIISNDHFPLGTGFSTFGSFFSGEYYSPIYFKYGLNTIYGISPENYRFIADTYWPMIVAQFGYIGFISFSLFLFYFFKLLITLNNGSNSSLYKRYCISCILLLTSLLIDSSSDSIFSQNRAVASFFYIALIVNSYKSQIDENNEELRP